MTFLLVADVYGATGAFLPLGPGRPELCIELPPDPRIRHVTVVCTAPDTLGASNAAAMVFAVRGPTAEALKAAAGSPGGAAGLYALAAAGGAVYCGYLAEFSPSIVFRPPTAQSLSGSVGSGWDGAQAGGPGAPLTIVLVPAPADAIDAGLPHLLTDAEAALVEASLERVMMPILQALQCQIVWDCGRPYLSLSDVSKHCESVVREMKLRKGFWLTQ